MLSIICNYFPLGVAVSASLIKNAQAQGCQESFGARHPPRVNPAAGSETSPETHPPSRPGFSRVTAGTEIHPDREQTAGPPPSPFGSSSAPRPLPQLARGADASPALTTAARGAAAPRGAGSSRPTPSSNLTAARRRRCAPSPPGPGRACVQWLRRGGSGARLPGAESGARPGGGGGAGYHASAAAPPLLGARHQVIPQEASRIGPGAQDFICISMAEEAP